MRKLLFAVCMILSFALAWAGESVDALKLREILRETSAVCADTSKLEADFNAQKNDLESRIKILKALKEKLKSDISAAETEAEKRRKSGMESAKELERFFALENSLKSAMGKMQISLPLERDDVYASARDMLSALKETLKNSGRLYVIKSNNGKRILAVGLIDEISEGESPEAAKLCDMLEGKAPYGIVRLKIRGKGAE